VIKIIFSLYHHQPNSWKYFILLPNKLLTRKNGKAMKVVLQYEKTIEEVKKEFTQAFPNLKLEFLPDKDNNKAVNPNSLPTSAILGEIRGALKEGSIIINVSNTIGEVKKAFQNQFLLPIQLYYQAGINVWLEADDHLTLNKQNKIASFFSTFSKRWPTTYSYQIITHKF
jgi:hypothetical protein